MTEALSNHFSDDDDDDADDCSSLTSSSGDSFYLFTDQSVTMLPDPEKPSVDGERQKLESERQKLEAERQKLQEERRKLKEERKKLRMLEDRGEEMNDKLQRSRSVRSVGSRRGGREGPSRTKSAEYDRDLAAKQLKVDRDKQQMEVDRSRHEPSSPAPSQKKVDRDKQQIEVDRSRHEPSSPAPPQKSTPKSPPKSAAKSTPVVEEKDNSDNVIDMSSFDLDDERIKAEDEQKKRAKELKHMEDENRRKTLENARKKLQDERKQRQEKIRERIIAEEVEAKRKKEAKKAAQPAVPTTEKNTDKARTQRAYSWYTKLAMPKREILKKKILLIPTIDITEEDVDLLPWNARGTMVNVPKLNAILFSRK
jgi:hypothetical protein